MAFYSAENALNQIKLHYNWHRSWWWYILPTGLAKGKEEWRSIHFLRVVMWFPAFLPVLPFITVAFTGIGLIDCRSHYYALQHAVLFQPILQKALLNGWLKVSILFGTESVLKNLTASWALPSPKHRNWQMHCVFNPCIWAIFLWLLEIHYRSSASERKKNSRGLNGTSSSSCFVFIYLPSCIEIKML